MSEPRAYYNEIDPAAAAVLRQCIADGVIAPGIVDTRSIKDVQPDDLTGFTQCHFFAGGGLWSIAARMAGWPDERPLWTGSCPCQPFSAAGKGLGTDDPRHLWPDFYRLIRAGRPPVVMGEQVAGAAGYGWLDGVRADLALEGYASRGVDIPALAVDAPHERNRLYWIGVADADAGGRLADSDSAGQAEVRRDAGEIGSVQKAQRRPEHGAALSGRGNDPAERYVVDAPSIGRGEGRPEPELRSGWPAPAVADASGVTLGDAFGSRLEGQPRHGDDGARWSEPHRPASSADGRNGSFWSEAEWIVCHDGKARRTKSGLPLLVDGLPGRVDLWRVGGNAIVPVLAAEVIRAFLDVEASGHLLLDRKGGE